MTIARTTRLIFSFYRNFAIASLAVTIIAGGLFDAYGCTIAVALFWLKAITNALFLYLIDHLRRKEYHYYYNLGLSKKALWSSTLIIDFALFFLTLIIVHACI
jgi:hypothetical protein